MELNTRQILAEPFCHIFSDRAEAEWAFDLLLATAKRLGIHDPYDPRFALTLTRRAGKPGLHLNFGGWLVLGFRSSRQVEMVLLAARITWDERFAGLPFESKEGEPEVRSYQLPLSMVRPLTSDLQAALEATMAFIAGKFSTWKRATPWKRHKTELVEALFDPDKRRQLFAEGLEEPELLYEPHRTAFYQDVSEEPETYEVKNQSELQIDVNENPAYSLAEIVEATGFDEVELARWVRAIERKGQAVLYGPPGTGKTFLSEQLARHLAGGGDGFWEVVQFHPAYAYEDFVQGIRPQSDGLQLSYPVVPGRFLEFCQKADTRDGTCVLIIDEINRANLARVFGELMYLLERRQREIPLAGGGLFKIPENVRLIGTMNTADRSIALVDHALRRRFAFLKLEPKVEVLRRYHHKTGLPVEGLINVLQRLNQTIQDEHYFVGITYFLREELLAQIEDIWKMEIEPYLEEYFFDQPQKVDEFRWERIRKEVLSPG